MTKFQIILTAVFGMFIIIGMVAFSMYRGTSVQKLSPVTIWGTVNQKSFNDFLSVAQGESSNSALNVTYVQVSEASFEKTLVEALASGRGPDAVLLPHTMVLKQAERIVAIPYTSLPERTYKDTFSQEAELYLTSGGIIGLPFIVDPLVLYWNRDLFSAGFVATPPKYWSDLSTIVPKLTRKDERLNITKSAIAMGAYNNVDHAKEILSALMLQAGTPITRFSGSTLQSELATSFGEVGYVPAQSAVDFFISFSDTSKPTYTWNRSMPNAKDAFVAGDLAMYIGTASELSEIRSKNPNLNFDIAMLPQVKPGNNSQASTLTYGTMYGLSVLKMSRVVTATFASIIELAGSGNVPALVQSMNLPPVRRDLLAVTQPDPYKTIFYNSALISRGWLDPDPIASDAIFNTIVQSVTTGRLSTQSAVSKAGQELRILINQ
ncbi:MAG: extracellular solute-binding protein [Candidatus Paceibacterota bacterium]|jgi:ABC-type glycerol-3-phosphate transport system substrate-binding protein